MGGAVSFPLSLRMASDAGFKPMAVSSAALHVAKICEQFLPDSDLVARVEAGRRLPELLAALPAARREPLKSGLGEAAYAELLSLAREKDSELFFSGLMRLAGRLAGQEPTSTAARLLYHRVESAAPLESMVILARQRRQALEGRGGFGAQTERFFHQLGQEAGDYRNLIALFAGAFAGSMIYNVSRMKIGRSLGMALQKRSQTVGIHPIEIVKMRFQTRTLAWLGAATGASLFDRGLRQLSGLEVAWDLRSLTRDTALALLDLGTWRMAVGISDLYRLRAVTQATSKNFIWKELESFAFAQSLATVGLGLALVARREMSDRGPETRIAAAAQWMSLLLGMNVGRFAGRRAVLAFR